jgi:hypothetical protein
MLSSHTSMTVSNGKVTKYATEFFSADPGMVVSSITLYCFQKFYVLTDMCNSVQTASVVAEYLSRRKPAPTGNS